MAVMRRTKWEHLGMAFGGGVRSLWDFMVCRSAMSKITGREGSHPMELKSSAAVFIHKFQLPSAWVGEFLCSDADFRRT